MKILISVYLLLGAALCQFSPLFLCKGQNQLPQGLFFLLLCLSVYLFGSLMIINSDNLQEMILEPNSISGIALYFCAVVGSGSHLYQNHLYSEKPDGSFALCRAGNYFFHTAYQSMAPSFLY